MAGAAAAEAGAATDASESASGVEEASIVGVAAAAATSKEKADTCSVCLDRIATEAFGAAIATCAVGSASQS